MERVAEKDLGEVLGQRYSKVIEASKGIWKFFGTHYKPHAISIPIVAADISLNIGGVLGGNCVKLASLFSSGRGALDHATLAPEILVNTVQGHCPLVLLKTLYLRHLAENSILRFRILLNQPVCTANFVSIGGLILTYLIVLMQFKLGTTDDTVGLNMTLSDLPIFLENRAIDDLRNLMNNATA